MAGKSQAVKELQDMFPSWDADTLADVLDSVNGKSEEAVNVLIAWSAESDQSLNSLVSSGEAAVSRVRPHLEPVSPYKKPKSCVFRIPADTSVPVILERRHYDHIMAKRLERKCGGRYLAQVLKVASFWHHRAQVQHAAARYPGTCSTSAKAVNLVQEDEELHRRLSNLSCEDAIVEGKELLRERCAFLGLRQIEMGDDGNCQFRAISQELFGTQDHHDMVRAEIVSYLRQHKTEYSDFFADDDWEHILTEIARPMTWGDEFSLRAAAEAFKARVHVLSSTETNWLLEYSPSSGVGENTREVFLTYVAPIHYNTVEPLR